SSLQRPVQAAQVGLELDGGVEAQERGIAAVLGEALDAAQEQVADAGPARFLSPDGRRPCRLREPVNPVDEEERLSLEPDVPRVLERAEEPPDVLAVVLFAVYLLQQHLVLGAVPAPRPVLVRPAEAERGVRLPRSQHLVEGPLQDAPAVEPV